MNTETSNSVTIFSCGKNTIMGSGKIIFSSLSYNTPPTNNNTLSLNSNVMGSFPNWEIKTVVSGTETITPMKDHHHDDYIPITTANKISVDEISVTSTLIGFTLDTPTIVVYTEKNQLYIVVCYIKKDYTSPGGDIFNELTFNITIPAEYSYIDTTQLTTYFLKDDPKTSRGTVTNVQSHKIICPEELTVKILE